MTKLGISFLAAALLAGIGATAAVPGVAKTVLSPAAAGAARSETGRPTIGPMLPGQLVEARIAFVRAALKITPPQQAQWAIVAAAMRDNARALDQAIMQARRQKLPVDATRRRAVCEDFDKVQDENDARLLTAIKPLYAKLSPGQRRVANELFVTYDVRRRLG